MDFGFSQVHLLDYWLDHMTSLFLVLYSELYLFSSNHPLYFWHKPNLGMMHYPFCVLLVSTEFLHPCSKECNTVVNFSCKDLSFIIRKADITYCQKNSHHHMTWEVFPLLQFSQKKKICIEIPCVCACPQSCSTLCGPIGCNPPDSPIHGIFQQESGVGFHFLHQGTTLSNLCLLHWKVDSYHWVTREVLLLY